MLRKRLPLSLVAGRLTTQVAVSVVATLIGSAMFSFLPLGSGPVRPPAVELTSGGKFAARIPGAAEAEPLSDQSRLLPSADGLAAPDTAMLPLLTATSAPAALSADMAAAADKPTRSKPHPARLAGLRHPMDTPPLPVARRSVIPDAVSTGGDEGMVPKIMTSARSLWSLSASAGTAVFSRLVP